MDRNQVISSNSELKLAGGVACKKANTPITLTFTMDKCRTFLFLGYSGFPTHCIPIPFFFPHLSV